MSKVTAIILAAGYGKRMNSAIAKQYMMLANRPILYYTMKAFQESDIDDIVLVVGAGEVNFVIDTIVKPYQFSKVSKVVVGGKERYHSVYEGLKAIPLCDFVLIHDGARPFVTKSLIHSIMKEVRECNACIAGVPSKDTIKIVDDLGFVKETPKRNYVWNVQTPQAFSYPLLWDAYEKLMQLDVIDATDDAMVIELMTEHAIRIISGNYDNIKITTPEDMPLAEAILKRIGLDKISI